MKNRVKKLIAVYVTAIAVLAGYAIFVVFTGIAIPCVFRLFTGFQCPGCGITRAALSLLHFDIIGAWRCNYMLPFVGIYIAYAFFYASREYLKTGKAGLAVKPEWLNITVLVLLCVWWVVRNILNV